MQVNVTVRVAACVDSEDDHVLQHITPALMLVANCAVRVVTALHQAIVTTSSLDGRVSDCALV